ncbi:type II toxin-antitoxin system HicB family antitoxin [Lactobacillus sp. PV037]|uniref:type II toxin-antitoxin system HicB family antitoxin n=1 Tax=Lactobacillus sp. PV037 TaxID=2594496 RepID=UPI0022400B9B|nr:type II toxin-antitoxin system HicB family antitoxin [Lactobacillus sp. PV037]QNQ83654.1 type II toxin-antitoxin system HicB family antitoxin [Lactobacillus sp. PV037]
MTLYFARFHKNSKKQYEVTFPDLEPYAATFGDSLEEALQSSHDSLTGYLLTQQDFNEKVPAPTKDPSKFDIVAPDFLVPVEVDLKLEREKEQNKLVKKTLTIPSFVNMLAKEANINFSATLTDALKAKLGIQ